MRTQPDRERSARRAGRSGMLAWLLATAVAVSACGDSNGDEDTAHTASELATNADTTITVSTQQVVKANWTGAGVHFAGFVKQDIDWNRIWSRVDFLEVKYARVMVNNSFYKVGYSASGSPIYEWNTPQMLATYKMLDYAQAHGITVVFGDWGNGSTIDDPQWAREIADSLDYLRNQRRYTCIKYYNYFNEPNGSWMWPAGSDSNTYWYRWKAGVTNLYNELDRRGFLSWLKITGPDVAGNEEWIGYSTSQIDGLLGAYDLHRYDSASTVESGQLETSMRALRSKIPAGKEFFMNETGIVDGKLEPDSQPNVKTHKYGVWTMDMVIQSMRAGMSGNIQWDLDDVQHDGGGYGQDSLKEWGFWNSYGGRDGYDASEVQPRPWFYTWSLMSKFFPQGCSIVQTDYSTSVSGLRATAMTTGRDFTFAIVNDSDTPRVVNVIVPNLGVTTLKLYAYRPNDYHVDGSMMPLPIDIQLTMLNAGMAVKLGAREAQVFTTMGPTPNLDPTPNLGPTPDLSVPEGNTVWLRSVANQRYVSAWLGGVNPLQARAEAPSTWEQFLVENAGSGLVALKSLANGNYVSAWLSDTNSPLQARATRVDTWERFQWVDLADGQVALRAQANQRYVSAWQEDPNSPLEARADAVQGWERFTWQALPGSAAAPGVVGYYAETWRDTNPPPAGANLGVAFSGEVDVELALEESASTAAQLSGTRYIALGGGNASGRWTAAGVDGVTAALKSGRFGAYDGIAYDVEEGDAGLAARFQASFAAARSAGKKVLVTISHSAPYGISDAGSLMRAFLADPDIDYISPQLYSSGTEAQNDYDTTAGLGWSAYQGMRPKLVPSVVAMSYYLSAQQYFAGLGLTTAGFIAWNGP